MRILQVIPYFFLSGAGDKSVALVERIHLKLIYDLSKSLLHRGHQVTIYTSDAFSEKRKLELGNRTQPLNMGGVKVYEFKSLGSKLARRHHICISAAMIPAVSREIHKFNVVHLHEYRTFQNIVAHHYAKKHGVPYVLQAHGSLPRIMSKKRLKQVYDNLWGYRLLKDASRVIAVTKMEAEQYKSMGVGEEKIEIVPNGIDLSEFDNLPERGEFRAKYGFSADQRIILYLGRIHKIKGLDLLVNAFAGLSKPLNDITLVIVGPDDGYLPSLKKLIADLEISARVLFTGPLYGQEKLKAYVDADVYVLPSIYETFPLTVLEAWACGTPVVVTDRCGIADVIDGQAGLVIPYDKEQLQHALLHVLDDDKIRLRFAEKGKLLVREKFNCEKIAEQIEDIYQSISPHNYLRHP